MTRVNGELIDPGLVEESFSRLKAEAEMLAQVSCCERDAEFLQQAEDEIVDGILLSQEAERRVPMPYPSEIRDLYEKTLRAWREHGASWELIEARKTQLKEEAIAAHKMERFTTDLFANMPPLGEEELRTWYDAHRSQFRTPPSAKVLHMVCFPQQDAGADPWDDYATMLGWRQQALAGADFEALARTHTAKRDGEIDLGWVTQERILNPFETMLFSLQENEISPVFLYEQALHIVKITELRPASVQPFEEVADSIRRELEAGQRHDALKKLADDLREKAVIERDLDILGL